MANNKQRYINTRFWNDAYVSELDPTEKLLFIYLLTNEHTNISGVYELPLKIMAIETGIDKSMFEKILPRLKSRVVYQNGYVIIKNFVKHQETGSDLVKKGIINCLKDLDKDFVKDIVNKGFYTLPQWGIDTLCIPYAKVLNYSDLDSDLDLDSIPSAKPSAVKQPKYTPMGAEVLKAFEAVDSKNKTYYANTTQRGACDFLIAEHGLEKVLGVVAVLPQINQMKLYLAQITTPYELKENWVKLGNKMKAKENEGNEKLNRVVW